MPAAHYLIFQGTDYGTPGESLVPIASVASAADCAALCAAQPTCKYFVWDMRWGVTSACYLKADQGAAGFSMSQYNMVGLVLRADAPRSPSPPPPSPAPPPPSPWPPGETLATHLTAVMLHQRMQAVNCLCNMPYAGVVLPWHAVSSTAVGSMQRPLNHGTCLCGHAVGPSTLVTYKTGPYGEWMWFQNQSDQNAADSGKTAITGVRILHNFWGSVGWVQFRYGDNWGRKHGTSDDGMGMGSGEYGSTTYSLEFDGTTEYITDAAATLSWGMSSLQFRTNTGRTVGPPLDWSASGVVRPGVCSGSNAFRLLYIVGSYSQWNFGDRLYGMTFYW